MDCMSGNCDCREDETVAVIGMGTMGRKIILLCLSAGLNVLAMSRSRQSSEKHLTQIRNELQTRVAKGRMAQSDVDTMMQRIQVIGEPEMLSRADFVIEAVNEDLNIKRALYREIDTHLAEKAAVATNTSSLSVSELSAGFADRSVFAGMHFFNPPEVMKLVEVRGSPETSQSALERACKLSERLGRTPIIVPDEPGYYVNRILFPMIIEGIRVLEASGGRPDDIDKAMQLGANLPMGPLRLADFIGNDIVLDICEILQERTGDNRFQPPELLRQMVSQGKLGRKSKLGFYEY